MVFINNRDNNNATWNLKYCSRQFLKSRLPRNEKQTTIQLQIDLNQKIIYHTQNKMGDSSSKLFGDEVSGNSNTKHCTNNSKSNKVAPEPVFKETFTFNFYDNILSEPIFLKHSVTVNNKEASINGCMNARMNITTRT